MAELGPAAEVATHRKIAAIGRVIADEATRVGSEMYGLVATNALTVLAEHVLSPALDVATAAGHDLRPGLRAIAAGQGPPP